MEALAPEALHGSAELAALVAQHVRAEVAVRARGVAFGTHRVRYIEHDCHGEGVVSLRERDERLACLWLDVGGVDDGELACLQALAGDEVKDVERGVRHRLAVLVVADQAATEVRGEHLGRQEVPGREARLTGSGHADERNQGQLGKRDLHRLNTAICVGEPRSAFAGPTPASSTV